MKKYIQPSIEINVLHIENALMAGSVKTDGDGNVQSVSGGGDFTGSSKDVLGNEGGSVWDEE